RRRCPEARARSTPPGDGPCAAARPDTLRSASVLSLRLLADPEPSTPGAPESRRVSRDRRTLDRSRRSAPGTSLPSVGRLDETPSVRPPEAVWPESPGRSAPRVPAAAPGVLDLRTRNAANPRTAPSLPTVGNLP